MAKLKEYYGHYCESEYEYAFIGFLEQEGWKYVSGNDMTRITKRDVLFNEDLETFLANDYRGLYSFEFANGSCFVNPGQIDIDAINVMKNSINQIRKEEEYA